MFINDRKNLPVSSVFRERPRVKELMAKGIKYSLFTIVSPPGYGKTIEAAGFLKSADIKLSWLRITQLDNLSSHFWNNLLISFKEESPEMAKKLDILGFPDTLAKMNSFVRIFAEEIYKGPLMTLVIDDFHLLQNEEIKTFLKYIIGTKLENFCLILIGRKNIDLEVEAERAGNDVFKITADDLKFTPDEVRKFFESFDIKLSKELLMRINEDTEGWPLMVHLLSLKLKINPSSYEESRGLSLDITNALFEADFFARYPKEVKQLLVKLSFTLNFNLEMIKNIGGINEEDFLKILDENVFVSYNYNTSLFSFQNMYKEFLAERQPSIPEDERARIFEIAGDCAIDLDQPLHSIEYYSQSKAYNKMLNAIAKFLGSNTAISSAHSRYFSDKINALPQEVKESDYLVDYVRVNINIQELRTQEAMDILQDMEKRLLSDDSEEAKKMLGEVYERMGGIQMLWRKECAMDYYKKAALYLPNGSNYKYKSMLRYKNFSIFAIEDYTPGAVERMEKALYVGKDYMRQVECGCSAGFPNLYSAEAAYYQYDFKRARIMAHEALREAEPADQYDIACDAYFILAKVECLDGNYRKLVESVRNIRKYVNKIQVPEMNEVADYTESWLDFVLQNSAKTLPWFFTTQFGIASMTPLVIGRGEFLYAIYLLQKEKYVELIAYLEQIKGFYMTKGWGDSLSTNVILAIAYFKANDKEKAMQVLWETYCMTYENKIITPFIEGAGSMRTLIDYARQSQYEFDENWLDNIYRKSSAYAKRLATMIKEHEKAWMPAQNYGMNLSKRELEVLYSLSQGLTRNEIADLYGLSVNTVKTTLNNLYNKLGAINRADAIRIASSAGIIN